MAIRIIAEPLLLSPDGTILTKAQISLALYFVDPLKYSERGLKEAMQAANPTRMAHRIAQHMAGHLKEYAQQILPTSQEQFQQCVSTADGSLEDKIAGFFNAKNSAVLNDSSAAFEALRSERQQAGVSDAGLRESLSYCAPEYRGAYLRDIRDTAVAEDDAFVQRATEARAKLGNALDYIPQYKKYAQTHDCTIISMADLLPVANVRACACAAGNLVAVDAGFLAKESPERIAMLLKEEILHLADEERGFSRSDAFMKAAEALFQDEKRVQEISNYVRPVHASQKISLRQMLDTNADPRQIRSELLVEYFHIRDHWLAIVREQGADSDVPATQQRADVDKIMQEMFGQELHQLCQAFESLLETQIAQVPTKSTRR